MSLIGLILSTHVCKFLRPVVGANAQFVFATSNGVTSVLVRYIARRNIGAKMRMCVTHIARAHKPTPS